MQWSSFVQYRWNVYKGIRTAIEQNEGGLDKFSQGEDAKAQQVDAI